MTKDDWTFDERTQTWLQGVTYNGSGVYQENNKWFGNIVHPLFDIRFFGPFDTKDDCIQVIIQEFDKIQGEYE